MVGYCVGLGNFWRFPYLCFSWGGALFFIPYFVCLFTIGLPVTFMELSLGQKFQRGDIGVFRGIHPRLSGVGLASVLAGFSIVAYYNIIIGWSLIYLIMSFISPLPWSVQNAKISTNPETLGSLYKDCDNLYITEEVFFKDIVKIIKDDCTSLDTTHTISEETVFGWEVYLATLAVWIIVYFIIWKGVNSSSYVVWVTVPMPVLFIFIMVLNGLTLENADAGIRMYLKGYDIDGNPPDLAEKLGEGKMWAQACGQIFFSLGICMGSMTSYSSFNPVDKPIIGDGFKIAFINSGISFMAGFAVFSVVGYLIGQGSPVAEKTASIGLAFIAYPAAIETMPAPNLWAFILGVTLFTLGIDSAFSMLEASATVMQDSPIFRKWPRKVIALFLCCVGSVFSILFSFNWGFTYFDVVDNYLNVYLMLLLGVLETFGAAWVYEAADVMAKGRGYKMGIMTLGLGYWTAVFIIPIASIFADTAESWLGLVFFWVWIVIVCVISFFISGLTWKEWRSNVMFSGVRKLSRAMTKLSKEAGDTKTYMWETIFEYWWGFSLKFWVPFALNFLIFFSLKGDIDTPYGGYHIFWQVMGFIYPLAGLLVFILSAIICKEPEPFDHDVDAAFDENDHQGTGAASTFEAGLAKKSAAHEAEMAAVTGQPAQ